VHVDPTERRNSPRGKVADKQEIDLAAGANPESRRTKKIHPEVKTEKRKSVVFPRGRGTKKNRTRPDPE
jgi:hypothetical protein